MRSEVACPPGRGEASSACWPVGSRNGMPAASAAAMSQISGWPTTAEAFELRVRGHDRRRHRGLVHAEDVVGASCCAFELADADRAVREREDLDLRVLRIRSIATGGMG